MTVEEICKIVAKSYYTKFDTEFTPESEQFINTRISQIAERIMNMKVVLDDYSITTVENFEPEIMNVLGVHVYGNKYITLKDCISDGDWYEAHKIAKKECKKRFLFFNIKKSFLPSKLDWQMYIKNEIQIKAAILAVGGKLPLSFGDYWADTESYTYDGCNTDAYNSTAWSFAVHFGGMHCHYAKSDQLHIRAFLNA